MHFQVTTAFIKQDMSGKNISDINYSDLFIGPPGHFPSTLREFLNQNHPEYVASVTDHWLNSNPPNQIVQFILAGILLVVSFPSQVCHALVIFVFLRQVFHHSLLKTSYSKSLMLQKRSVTNCAGRFSPTEHQAKTLVQHFIQ